MQREGDSVCIDVTRTGLIRDHHYLLQTSHLAIAITARHCVLSAYVWMAHVMLHMLEACCRHKGFAGTRRNTGTTMPASRQRTLHGERKGNREPQQKGRFHFPTCKCHTKRPRSKGRSLSQKGIHSSFLTRLPLPVSSPLFRLSPPLLSLSCHNGTRVFCTPHKSTLHVSRAAHGVSHEARSPTF